MQAISSHGRRLSRTVFDKSTRRPLQHNGEEVRGRIRVYGHEGGAFGIGRKSINSRFHSSISTIHQHSRRVHAAMERQWEEFRGRSQGTQENAAQLERDGHGQRIAAVWHGVALYHTSGTASRRLVGGGRQIDEVPLAQNSWATQIDKQWFPDSVSADKRSHELSTAFGAIR